jgi:hypothetical protein
MKAEARKLRSLVNSHVMLRAQGEKMKRFKILAIFVGAMALSLQAQSADGEAAKGPLSAAEKAQCLAQLNEFNQGVRVYNAELDQIKALEVEIDALRAELEKEQAAVDQRDSAALKALNAKIGKNNELVEWHEQMSSSIKAKASENKQRSEQFREACENRLPAPPRPAQLQSTDAACSSATGAKDVERKIEATFATIRADEKEHQAEVERVADTRAKAQSWSAEKRSKIWLQLLGSPKFMAFERQKQPYVQDLMRILVSKPKNGQEECRLVQRIAAMLPAIKAINARQYAFMADEIRVAK